MDPKEKKGQILDSEELADVRGGTSTSEDCPDKDTTRCSKNPYTCGTPDENNKNHCTYG